MPIFNLELKFNDDGSLDAVRKIDDISNSASNATKELKRTGKQAQDIGDSISNAMHKAALKVLGLVSAWKALSMAQRTFTLGSGYNERIEKAQLGIASVVAATNELEDSQGRLLKGQDKFIAAQEISVKMAKALDVASMQSPAEYNDLLSTFQTLLAPATQLGLKWQDTLDVTIRMSNVLSSLGLDMKSLAGETQAILTGTNISRSAVASRLGITKAEIESWGKGEQLLANLEKRLESFKYSGQAVENTMEAVRAYFEDVLANLAGDAVTGLWDQVKTGLTEVADAFYEIDEQTKEFKITDEMKGLIEISQEVSNAIGKEFVSAIRTGLDTLRSLGTYVSEIGVSQFLGDIKTYSGIAIAGITALMVARKAASAQWAVEVAGTKDGIAAIYKHTAAAIRDTQAKHQNALASKAEIQAEINSLNVKLRLTQAILQNSQSTRVLIAAKEKQIAILNQLTAAEARLAAADKLINRTTITMTALSKVGSSLLSLFGGPLGLALTGIGLGVGYLATKQSHAEKAANLHADALRNFTKAAESARKAGKDLSDQLDELGENQKARAIEDARKSIEESKKSLDTGSFYIEAMPSAMKWGRLPQSALSEQSKYLMSVAKGLDDLKKQTRDGQVSLQDYKKELDSTYTSLSKMELGQTKLAEAIRKESDAVKAGAESEKLLEESISGTADIAEQSEAKINANATALNGLIESIDLLIQATKGEINSDKEALEYLEKRYETTKAGKEALEENARAKDENALKTLQLGIAELEAAYNAAQAIAIMEGATQAQIDSANKLGERLDFLKSRYAEFVKHKGEFKLPGSGGGGGRKKTGGKSGVDEYTKAIEKWDELQDKLAQLQGKSDGAAASLKKTLKEIEETGKKAKKTAGEIETLKQAFVDASDVKTMRELNKELLQLEGNTRAVQDIENKEKVENYAAKLSSVQKLNAAEKEALLGRYQAAVVNAQDKQNIETRLNFYKELADLSGNYGASIEYQNQLIEKQAKEWELAGIPLADIEERVRLMKQEIARDPFSGMVRGLKSYANEATDLANQMQDAMGNAFQGIEDAFVNMVQTGKMSFSDLAQSIINDLIRISVRASITGPLASALGDMFGSFFSKTPTSTLGTPAAVAGNTGNYIGGAASAAGWRSAHGNVFSGGNIATFSNKIVKGPTLFDYNKHLTAFAKGAGIMGEAGAEAILPLKRDKNGDLGVRMTYENTGNNLAYGEYAKIISELNSQILQDRQQSSNNIPAFNVNIENNSNAQVQADQMRRDGNGGFTVDILVSQVEQAMVSRAKQGKSALMQYQEKAYGMNRAQPLARGRGRN